MIDEAHPCAGMKYLRNKPVKDLAGADFLRLVQAEGEGLLETKIGIDLDQGAQESRRPGSLQSYFEEIRQLFYRVYTMWTINIYHSVLFLTCLYASLCIKCVSVFSLTECHILVHCAG